MKRPARLVRCAAVAAVLAAGSGTAPAATPHGAPARYVPLTPAELDRVAAPVALLPDALLAQVLLASGEPLEVVMAAQWAKGNQAATAADIAGQGWVPAVQALVRYPAVLEQLAGDAANTRRLGLAYRHQPADVMASIQRLRRQAQAAGSLYTTPQQQVATTYNYVEIIPSSPDVIYVPVYDPGCYVRRTSPKFHAPCRGGEWLDHHLDWRDRVVREGHRGRHDGNDREGATTSPESPASPEVPPPPVVRESFRRPAELPPEREGGHWKLPPNPPQAREVGSGGTGAVRSPGSARSVTSTEARTPVVAEQGRAESRSDARTESRQR